MSNQVAQALQGVTNYMVPAGGTTHAVICNGTFSNAPYTVDWRQFKIDNFPFQPQGAFIDNTAGTVPLVLTINPIGWKVTCPPGEVLQTQFPAPNGQTTDIVGDPANICTVIFVDFPVLPYASGAASGGPQQVELVGSTNTDPIPTIPSPTSQGLPYRTQTLPSPATLVSGSIEAGATNTSQGAPAASNLRRLRVEFSGDSAYAAAAETSLVVTLNGTPIYSSTVYIPGAVGNAPPAVDLDFSNIAFASGGNLVVTLGAALATGVVSVNAYFSAV